MYIIMSKRKFIKSTELKKDGVTICPEKSAGIKFLLASLINGT
jgi:hypothetical protein